MNRLCLLMLVVVAAFAPAPAAEAQQQQAAAAQQASAPRESVIDAAARVPVDTDLVLVIDNASQLRSSALAEAFATVSGPTSPLNDSRQAWQALAAELGWTDAEAFDHLLGRRIMLVARGIDTADAAQWVLLSEVSLATDRRLKERLKAAPRAITQGQQVLAIEQGRYELTSFRHAGRLADDAGAVTILLAPAARSQLLETMLARLVGGAAGGWNAKQPPRLLGQESIITEARTLGDAEVLLLSRLGPRAGDQPVTAWPDFLAVTASRARDRGAAPRWVLHVALREHARQQDLLAAAMSSDAVFNAFAPASLLTVVQMAPLSVIFGRSLPFDDPLTNLPWPPAAAELFTGRQAIRIHSAPGEQGEPGLVCTLAMETTSAEQLAPVLDPAIGTFFTEVERAVGQRNETTPAFANFAGIAPRATRIATVELGSAGPLSDVTGPGLSVAWAYPRSADQSHDWWTLALAAAKEGQPRVVAAVADAAAAVGGGGGKGGKDVPLAAENRRWIWFLAAKPRQLESLFAPGVPDLRGLRTFMKRVEDVGCRLSITDAGDVRGEVTLELVEEQGR